MGGNWGGGPLVVLEKLEFGCGCMSIMSLIGLFHNSRSRPSRIRMSMARALDGCEITRKKLIVLWKRSRSVGSSTNGWSVGSLNAAARVRRLPHCLQRELANHFLFDQMTADLRMRGSKHIGNDEPFLLDAMECARALNQGPDTLLSIVDDFIRVVIYGACSR